MKDGTTPSYEKSIKEALDDNIAGAIVDPLGNKDKAITMIAQKCALEIDELSKQHPYLTEYIQQHAQEIAEEIALSAKADTVDYLHSWIAAKSITQISQETGKTMLTYIVDTSGNSDRYNKTNAIREALVKGFEDVKAYKGMTGTWQKERDALVEASINEIMKQVHADPRLVNNLHAQIKENKLTLGDHIVEKASIFLSSKDHNKPELISPNLADLITGPHKPQKQAQIDKDPNNPSSPEKGGTTQFKLHEFDQDYEKLNGYLSKSVVVFKINNSDDTFVHKAIVDAQTKNFGTTALNKHINDAIEDALKNDRLKPISPERTDKGAVYKTDQGSLTISKNKDGKLILEASGNFSGVVRVPPKGTEFEAIEFKDGKTVAWNKADPAKSKIVQILHEAEGPSVMVSGPVEVGKNNLGTLAPPPKNNAQKPGPAQPHLSS